MLGVDGRDRNGILKGMAWLFRIFGLGCPFGISEVSGGAACLCAAFGKIFGVSLRAEDA